MESTRWRTFLLGSGKQFSSLNVEAIPTQILLQTNAVSQNMIQRYLSLPSLQAGKRAVWIFVTGVVVLMMLCSYNGLLMYATYKHCDPLTTKLAKVKGELNKTSKLNTSMEKFNYYFRSNASFIRDGNARRASWSQRFIHCRGLLCCP